ncbi:MULTISPECIES: NAD(P)-dependent oxidoreductase [unclassified Micromonospora]|uniref:NAD-dependent epimerase/dehydratase family protein n=1 Tax=unclassified Micromonospora TaxID=2617518 RepID=UPI001C5D5903|nr:NAD(P)-dependent oxidoreductase [Micromonospora sp. RL09-050-HVF-A]MBW4705347.1 NAD(P)-dependent oxidoreductase [Micromonospora sp. RL09-050-HVF-A]
MTRVLLFGASGFIGGHARDALAADHRVTEVICPGRAAHDLLDGTPAALTGLLREVAPDAVVNCVGALTGTAAQLVTANTLVAAKLLAATADAVPQARLVRLGSAGEYGPVPQRLPVTEDAPARPVSAYGVSHLAGTRLFQLAGEAGEVDAVSLRVFNPIGPGMSQENLLGRAADRLRAALADGATEITLGPLSAYRDFVDVRDLAALIVAATLAPELPHRVVNAGSGRAVTAREAVGLLAGAAGYDGRIREVGVGPQRSQAVDWIQAGIGRAGELGWSPVRDLETSIKDIWAAGAAR